MAMDTQNFKISVDFKIPKQHIRDQFDNLTREYSPWLKPFSLPEGSYAFTAKFDRPEDDEGTYRGVQSVNYLRIKWGLQLMAAGSPDRFQNIVKGDCDAIDADIFMQYVIFGKVIYG